MEITAKLPRAVNLLMRSREVESGQPAWGGSRRSRRRAGEKRPHVATRTMVESLRETAATTSVDFEPARSTRH